MGLLIHKLKKTYVAPDASSVPVIDIESFDLADGEQVALIGTSGSGKTTLLHMIAGILAPDSGTIAFNWDGESAGVKPQADAATLDYRSGPARGIQLEKLSEAQRDVFRGRYIGYIFQTHHLLGGFTALENVLLGMSFAGGRPDTARAVALLTRVGLAHRLTHKPSALSVGEQQRVAVARALINRPKLLLADEPTANVDTKHQQQIIDLVRETCREEGVSLVLVTHATQVSEQFERVEQLEQINQAVGVT